MTLGACRRERELEEAMKQGFWPVACAEELRAHVHQCQRCDEVARVRTALGAMLEQDIGVARVQSPSLLLWRAQLRRRYAAMERVSRPMERAYLFALGLLSIALAGVGAISLGRGADWWTGVASAVAAAGLMGGGLLFWATAAGLALLGVVALCLAVARK